MTTPEQITTVEELEALPEDEVIRDAKDILWWHAPNGRWFPCRTYYEANEPTLPVSPLRPDRPVGPDVEDPRDGLHFWCDCVPDLGPAHCHACSVVNGKETPWDVCVKVPHPSVVSREQVEVVAEALSRTAYRMREALTGDGGKRWNEFTHADRKVWIKESRAILAKLGLPVEEEK